MLNYYKNTESVVIAHTLRHKGNSNAPFDSLNMSFYVGDNNQDVLANRHLIANEIGIPLSRWVLPKITHSNNLHKVTIADLGKGAFSEATSIFNVDGVYTDLTNVLLCVFHADCIPFVFYDSKKRLIGVVHAGWKGTLKKIVDDFLNQWIKHELCNPQDIEVIIGPSLSKKNFVVKKDVIDQVKASTPEFMEHLKFIQKDEAYFNAIEMNVSIMKSHGLLASNITINQDCTYDNQKKYFSYRRNHTTGRHITCASMR